MRSRKANSRKICSDSPDAVQLSIFDLSTESAASSFEPIQKGEPLWCRTCRQFKDASLFERLEGGWRLHCTVCCLVNGYRSEREKPEQRHWKPEDFDHVPLKGFETNKPERYTIFCDRCKKKINPQKTIIVGAVCENCWLPHERADMQAMHDRWNGKFEPAMKRRRPISMLH